MLEFFKMKILKPNIESINIWVVLKSFVRLDFFSCEFKNQNFLYGKIQILFSQRLSQDEPIIPAQILEPPSLPNHSSLPGAASILELKHENNRGRYVIANKPVKVGDVLFSELPYASILLPEHYSSHCHHCVSKFSMEFCFQNCPHLL